MSPLIYGTPYDNPPGPIYYDGGDMTYNPLRMMSYNHHIVCMVTDKLWEHSLPNVPHSSVRKFVSNVIRRSHGADKWVRKPVYNHDGERLSVEFAALHRSGIKESPHGHTIFIGLFLAPVPGRRKLRLDLMSRGVVLELTPHRSLLSLHQVQSLDDGMAMLGYSSKKFAKCPHCGSVWCGLPGAKMLHPMREEVGAEV